MSKFTTVKGKSRGSVDLYALSTCIWCRKTRNLLEDLGVAFNYVYVDLLEEDDRDTVMQELEKWNPRRSYPTLVLNNKTCIVGFKEEEIREALQT